MTTGIPMTSTFDPPWIRLGIVRGISYGLFGALVFEEPLDLAAIPGRVEELLRDLRLRDLATAGLPASVPIQVAENGWPTGTNPLSGTCRSSARQAEVIDAVVRTVHRLRRELNISHYILFGLRDADSCPAPVPPVRHHARRLHPQARLPHLPAAHPRTRHVIPGSGWRRSGR